MDRNRGRTPETGASFAVGSGLAQPGSSGRDGVAGAVSARFRFVLFGGRTLPRPRSTFAHLLFVWLPVAFMLAVIARESTASFGGIHTSPVLRPFWERIFGHVNDAAWEWIHHLIRKTGHFIGYGTFGLTWLRAFLLTWISTFRRVAAGVWRRWSYQAAIVCTAIVASMDEVHQNYLPDRTGQVQDVLLDTIGALAFCSLVSLFWLRRSARFAEFRERF